MAAPVPHIPFFQPGEEFFPFLCIFILGHLMHHVAGSVAIGNDDAALFVEALPFHAIGSKAVYRIKREAA